MAIFPALQKLTHVLCLSDLSRQCVFGTNIQCVSSLPNTSTLFLVLHVTAVKPLYGHAAEICSLTPPKITM